MPVHPFFSRTAQTVGLFELLSCVKLGPASIITCHWFKSAFLWLLLQVWSGLTPKALGVACWPACHTVAVEGKPLRGRPGVNSSRLECSPLQGTVRPWTFPLSLLLYLDTQHAAHLIMAPKSGANNQGLDLPKLCVKMNHCFNLLISEHSASWWKTN